MSVPKSALGISGEDYTVNFKWTDNVQDEDGSGAFKGEILDFYRTGDAAPGGRFKYSFTATSDGASQTGTEKVTETAPAPVQTEPSTAPSNVTDKAPAGEDPAENKGLSPVVIAIIAAAAVIIAAAAILLILKKKKK
jgi:hypothetical protein